MARLAMMQCFGFTEDDLPPDVSDLDIDGIIEDLEAQAAEEDERARIRAARPNPALRNPWVM